MWNLLANPFFRLSHPCCMRAQSCLTLWDPKDCSLPGSSVHGILQARILERVAVSFSRGLSRPRDWTRISCIGRRILYHWATWEELSHPWTLPQSIIRTKPVSKTSLATKSSVSKVPTLLHGVSILLVICYYYVGMLLCCHPSLCE